MAGKYCERVNKMSYLFDLVPGEVACIASTPRARRLIELGMIGGTRIECVAVAPLGDSKAFLVRGAVIALRSSEAGTIRVQRIPHASRLPLARAAGLRSGETRWG